MAQTKVKLISDGVIVQGNLHASHGITTADIGEGSNLYYTDARVGSYLSTNSFATESYVGTQIANLVDSSPSALNTLNELAAALGDDANFSTTVTNSIALKAPLASPSFTGNATFGGTVLIDGVSNYTGLEVKGAGASRPQIKFSNVNQGTLAQIYGTESNSLVTTVPAGLEYQVRNANGAGGDHVFKSYNTAILTLDGGTNNATFAGDVNIGQNESTATRQLTIGQGRTGNGFSFIDLVGDATYTDYGLRMLRGNGGANALSILEHRGTGAFEIKTAEAAPIVFETSGTERMRIDSSGTTTITNGTNDNTLFLLNGARGRRLRIEEHNTGNGGIAITSQDNDETGTTNSNNRTLLLNASGGNVGIGITSPSKLLHLYGADATVQIQGLGTSSNAGVDFFPRDGSDVAHLQSIKGVGSNLTFLTGGNSGNSYVPTEKMRIDSSGAITTDVTGEVDIPFYVDGYRTGVQQIWLNNSRAANSSNGRGTKLILGAGNTVGAYFTHYTSGSTGNGVLDIGVQYTGVTTQSGLEFNTNSNRTVIKSVGSSAAYTSFQSSDGTERMRITSGGNTLIGITTEQNAGRLQIQSGTSENGGILDIAGGGWYRYYTRVCRNATSAGAAGYWHIKTNIAANSNTMFLAKFYGYIYGSAQIVDLTHAGYAYSGTSSVINQAVKNNGTEPNASSAVYISASGSKVTFRIAFGTGSNFSTYFAGVTMDIAFLNPAGQGIDFEIEAQSFSTSTTVY